MTTEVPNKPLSNSADYHFAGFNGFGQFRTTSADDCLLTKELTAFQLPPDDCGANSPSHPVAPLISCTWSYNAIAIGNRLWLSGALAEHLDPQPASLPFATGIRKLATNDRWCLVLLADGSVHKVCIRSMSVRALNFISTETSRSPQSTIAVGRRKRIFPADEAAAAEAEAEAAAAEHVTDIACCQSFSVALTSANAVYCVPTLVHRFGQRERIVKMCAGSEHVLMLSGNGDVYVMGSSLRGQLGQGDTATEDVPVLLDALAGIKVVDIGAGNWHSAAVSAFGDLYTWGWNLNGQTGRPVYDATSQSNPPARGRKLPTVFATADVIDLPCPVQADGRSGSLVPVEDLANQYEVVGVWCGARHTIVRTRCGRWLSCGWNRYGQLGRVTASGVGAVAADDEDCFADRFAPIEAMPEGVRAVVAGSWCTVFA